MESKEYVTCALCGYKGKNIKGHVKREHGLTKSEYQSSYGPTLSESARQNYSRLGHRNKSKLKRWSEMTPAEQEAFRLKVSKGAKRNKADIIRRRQQMKAWNKSPKGRKVASETAKRTSARPEILEARSKNLRRWRVENREEFFNKCVKPLTSTFKSHGEESIAEFLRGENLHFKWGSQIKSDLFVANKSRRKQVDFIDRENKIIIEFDGPHHFMSEESASKKGMSHQVRRVKENDKALEKFSEVSGYLLIRVGWSCYNGHKKSIDPKALQALRSEILEWKNDTPQPKGKILKLGEEYNV